MRRRYWEILLRGDWQAPQMPGWSNWLLLVGAIAIIVVVIAIISSLSAEPPPGPVDPELSKWYQSLTVPGTYISCCSIADCRPTEYKMNEHGYLVFIDGAWTPVPGDIVIHNLANPTGSGVLCRSKTGVMLCFVPGDDT